MPTRRRRLPDPKRTTLSAIHAVLALVLAGTACAEPSRGTAVSPGVCAGTGSATAARDETPGLTALGSAALYGDLEAVELQLGEGADVNAVSARGLSPLMLSFQPLILPPAKSGPDPDSTQAFRARQLRKLEIAKLLLDRAADPALSDCNGLTAVHHLLLMHADESDLIATLKILTQKGADPDAPTLDGVTGLMLATQRNLSEVVKYLLLLGVDPKATAKDGRTALSVARARGYDKIAELLEQKL